MVFPSTQHEWDTSRPLRACSFLSPEPRARVAAPRCPVCRHQPGEQPGGNSSRVFLGVILLISSSDSSLTQGFSSG